MAARVVFALSFWAAVSKASGEAGDSVALAQWTYRVSPATLEAGARGPSGAQPVLPRSERIQDIWDVLRLMPEALNATKNLQKRHERPVDDDEDFNLQEMMKFLNDVTEAVRSTAFRGNITQLFKSMVANSKDYLHKGMAAMDKFAFSSRTVQDKEMPALAIWLLNNMTNNSISFGEANREAFKVAAAAIPKDMLQLINKTACPIGDLLSQPLLPTNVTATQVCSLADARACNTSGALVTLHKAIAFMNTTKAMLPMMDDFLNQTRPEVADRIHNLVVNFVNSASDIITDGTVLWNNVLSETKPVLKARLGCQFSAGAAPRLGLGLAALAALLAAWLEL
uniref:Uncharacterized protein n=1 Tax=Alexandrium monilatum TaxID=311494 RepID=A0A7S4PUV6_9DINO|mmetsp:Transcript_42280/g.126518  ORF Transcript_42280/g.126518 Transcript_42280/m.126518 type:complete len:339 (+) Transcript_42280:58-1074(+)|eukprot:CAMPEP_0175194438 /NCGR_PEP_ID=MMETSP0093-20121207/6493_1 /TAXON_ID=311494 /ORGANISM="Alexandrium monilatum, Strain CCMP3105" /LENGTH=338 /DNA_ID=CAMNT_0016487363 /DNA_START=53 /DNA_END=1069 /DNA_ORIENTATION=+